MSGPTLRVLADDGSVADSLLVAAHAAARSGRPAVVTWRAYLALVDELGSPEAAAAFVIAVVEQTGKPLVLNTPALGRPDHSTSCLIPPHGWTQERASGYLGGLKDVLEAEFGWVDGRPQRGREWWAENRQQRRARKWRERKGSRASGRAESA